MNLIETVNLQMEAYFRVTTELLKWRPILVYSVLQVTPPSLIFKAMKETDEACRKPSESGLRQLLADTARQMGLQELPKGGESGGRPSAESCERYRREQAAPWILANGGMPRPEQLADPFWDLRPQRPSPSGFAAAMPDTRDAATPKEPSVIAEPAGSQTQAVPATPAPTDPAPPMTAGKPIDQGKQGTTGKAQPAGRKKSGVSKTKAHTTPPPDAEQTQQGPSADDGKPEGSRERIQRLLREKTKSFRKNKDGEIVSTRLPVDLKEAKPPKAN
jgi:hypothetical protein